MFETQVWRDNEMGLDEWIVEWCCLDCDDFDHSVEHSASGNSEFLDLVIETETRKKFLSANNSEVIFDVH